MKPRTLQILLWMAVAPAIALGQLTVDVSQFGARGDGKTDDTVALQNAINMAPAGVTLTFGGPSQVYLIHSRLTLQPGRSYGGQGTIKMSSLAPAHTAIAKLSYGAATQVAISGITFDANGVGGALQFAVDGSNAIPASSIQVDHVTFRNTSATPTGPWDGAIYAPVGLTNSQLTYNQVINCAFGMTLVNLNSVTIAHNSFQTVHIGDAISVTFVPAPFAYGQGIQISQNTGQHLGRMGIELWPSGGNVVQTSHVQGLNVSNNTFSDWDPGFNNDAFGISVMAGTGALIQGNSLFGATGGYGIELGAPQSTVTLNKIQGFATGVILHDTPSSVVAGNVLTGQAFDGIEFSNAPGSRANVILTGNSILNAQVFGIYMNTSTWGGASIKENFITRAAGTYGADTNQNFTGIATTPPNSPVNVAGNVISQSATTGPGGFGFIGIRLNGSAGANAASTYQQNTVSSASLLPGSYGVYGNAPGSLDNVLLKGNSFSSLYSASGGAGSTGVVLSGNQVYNCTAPGPIALAPAQ